MSSSQLLGKNNLIEVEIEGKFAQASGEGGESSRGLLPAGLLVIKFGK